MNDQFVLLLNKSYLNSGKPRNSGQFMADQTFHYIKSTLYFESSSLSPGHYFLEIKLPKIGRSMADTEKCNGIKDLKRIPLKVFREKFHEQCENWKNLI